MKRSQADLVSILSHIGEFSCHEIFKDEQSSFSAKSLMQVKKKSMFAHRVELWGWGVQKFKLSGLVVVHNFRVPHSQISVRHDNNIIWFFLPARRIRRKEGTALGVSNQ